MRERGETGTGGGTTAGRHHHSYRREGGARTRAGGVGASASTRRVGPAREELLSQLSEKERKLEAIKDSTSGRRSRSARPGRRATGTSSGSIGTRRKTRRRIRMAAPGLWRPPFSSEGAEGVVTSSRVGKGSGLGHYRRWSDKSLEEMTRGTGGSSRRTSISFKGSRIPRPFRSWDDAARSMPESILRV